MTMKTRSHSAFSPRVALLGLAMAALAVGSARAQDLREAGRRVVDQYQQAIVTVRITSSVKVSYGGQDNPEQESKIETSGTVIGPDGLTLLLLSAVDPASALRGRMDQNPNFKIDTQVKDVKIMLADRSELAATVVLRDPELDIAFIRPSQKPDKPLKSIDLAQSVEAGMLEPVFVLARLGRVADRAPAAMTGEIQAIVAKPRKFYVPSAELASGGPAVPIFNAKAQLVGFVMGRRMPGAAEDDVQDMMGAGSGSSLAIVMPADQVAEIVKQVPAADK
jgi:hypothetical protein